MARLIRDGGITVLDSDLTLSNGLAWSVDGRQMFSVDTLSQRIFVRYSSATTTRKPVGSDRATTSRMPRGTTLVRRTA